MGSVHPAFSGAAIDQHLERDVAEYLGEPQRRMLPRFDVNLLDGSPPVDRNWIVPGFIPEREVTLFTGPGGAGKSLFAQQLATCLAARRQFLGLPTNRYPDNDANVILYITAEDDDHELHRRQRNIMAAIGASRADLGDRLFLSSLRGRIGNELATFDRDGELERTETYQLLSDTIMEAGAAFVILDNVAHLFAGNENDRGQVTRFVNLLYSLVKVWGITILLLGHPNKSGDAYSGSTAWLNAVRSQIDISRNADEQGNVLDPDARTLKLGKANYARQGQTLGFRWHDFAFVLEDDLPADTRAELAETQKIVAENEAFLACLRERAQQGDGRAVGPSPGPNYAPAQFSGQALAKGFGKAPLKRAMDRLFHIGRIEAVEVTRPGKSGTKTIIREVPERSPEPFPNTVPERPELTARTTPHTHSIPKGIMGAAHRAAAPNLDGGDDA
ncbi:MAG: AAA family ATPase [Erythrobacter sp.]|nr:AAA family ATPase [Erythrobacter sp.]